MPLTRSRLPWKPFGCALLALVTSMSAGAQTANPVNPADADNAADAARKATVRDLALQDGAYQRVLFYAPSTALRGVIVMFPGGAGDVGIERDGQIRNGENFVVRTRELWAQRGYGVLIVDAIGRDSLRGERSTPQYAAVVREVLTYANTLTDRPVWVWARARARSRRCWPLRRRARANSRAWC